VEPVARPSLRRTCAEPSTQLGDSRESPNPVSPSGHPGRCHQLGRRARRDRVQVLGQGSPRTGVGVRRRHASQASHGDRAPLLEGPRQHLAPQLSTADEFLPGELLATDLRDRPLRTTLTPADVGGAPLGVEADNGCR
jgi:hypothetical protein